LVWIGTGFAAGLAQCRARVFQPGKDKSIQELQFFVQKRKYWYFVGRNVALPKKTVYKIKEFAA
jgi:hypothetical protein